MSTQFGRILAIVALTTLLCVTEANSGQAKGTLSFKRTTLALKFVYLVSGPDAFDASQKIRRLIFSTKDLSAKLQACTKMSCSDGAVEEGMTVDLTGGPRLNYWVVLKGGRVQYSGTAEPAALKARTDEPTKLSGSLTIDDSAADGAKVELDFEAALLKEFSVD